MFKNIHLSFYFVEFYRLKFCLTSQEDEKQNVKENVVQKEKDLPKDEVESDVESLDR